MSADEKLIGIYTGPGLAVPASNLIRIPTVAGTISDVTVDLSAVADGDTSFNLLVDGVLVTAVTVLDTTENTTVTGLSTVMVLGKVLSLDLIAPFPTSLPDPPISLVITYDDGVTTSLSDGNKGDITVSSSGAVWTIDNDVVTYAKMQNVSAASKLLGRGSSGSGDAQELTLGTGLSMSGTTLNATATGGGAGTFNIDDGTSTASGTFTFDDGAST